MIIISNLGGFLLLGCACSYLEGALPRGPTCEGELSSGLLMDRGLQPGREGSGRRRGNWHDLDIADGRGAA